MAADVRGLLAVALCLAAQPRLHAQTFVEDVAQNGTVAASFLEIGVGARAEAMGGAYAAEAGFAEMIYWNPAGLAHLRGVSAAATHTEWLAETDFDFLSVAAPLPFYNAVFAASVTSLTVPEQEVRTAEAPQGTGEFYDARDYAVNVSVAARLIDAFAVGVTGKYIHQRIWSESGSQFALDVGVRYETPLSGLAIASSIANFGGDLRLSGKNLNDIIDPDLQNRGVENVPVAYETDAFPLPQLFRFGVRYDAALPGRGNLATAVNLLHPAGATESMNLGFEYGFADLIFFRAGYQNLLERDAINGLTLGGGLQYTLQDRSRFVIDYAWSDWGDLRGAHRISAGIYL